MCLRRQVVLFVGTHLLTLVIRMLPVGVMVSMGACRAPDPGLHQLTPVADQGNVQDESSPVSPSSLEELVNMIRGDYALREFERPLSSHLAEDILMRTRCFSTGSTALGAEAPPRQVHAFNVLLDSTIAGEAFGRLLESKNPVARLYGVCGTFYLAPNKYLDQLACLRSIQDEVVVLDGCVTETMTVKALLAMIVQRSLPEELRSEKQAVYDVYGMGAG